MHNARSEIERELNRLLAERALRHPSGEVVNRPVHVYLQLASACNLDCFMCSEHLRPEIEKHGKGLRSFRPELFERLERSVFPFASELTFGVGGEPTLADRFVKYSHRAADSGLALDLVTNGSRLAVPDVAEVVGQRFRRINVSVDAATAATHESIRKGSSWSRVVYGLEQLSAFRSRSTAPKRAHIVLSMVLMRRNVDELPALVELAARLELDSVYAQPLIPITPAAPVEQLTLEPDRYDRALDRARERAAELGVVLVAPPPFRDAPAKLVDTALAQEPNGVGPIPCKLPRVSVNVLVDGGVAPCCHPIAHQRMLLGNLAHEDFESIWFGALAAGLRRGLADGSAPSVCRTCSIVHGRPQDPRDGTQLPDDWTLAQHLAGSEQPTKTLTQHLEQSGVSGFMRDTLEDREAAWHERNELAKHAGALERELAGVSAHAATTEREWHKAGVEAERLAGTVAQLHRHIAHVEQEHAIAARALERYAGLRGALRVIARSLSLPRWTDRD